MPAAIVTARRGIWKGESVRGNEFDGEGDVAGPLLRMAHMNLMLIFERNLWQNGRLHGTGVACMGQAARLPVGPAAPGTAAGESE